MLLMRILILIIFSLSFIQNTAAQLPQSSIVQSDDDYTDEIDRLIDNLIANAEELQAQATIALLNQAAINRQAHQQIITALKRILADERFQSPHNHSRWQTRQRALLILIVLSAHDLSIDEENIAHKIVVIVEKSHYNITTDQFY